LREVVGVGREEDRPEVFVVDRRDAAGEAYVLIHARRHYLPAVNDGSICTRRSFVRAMARLGALPLGISALAGCRAARAGRGEEDGPHFRTRGVVLVPDDLTLADWPRRAADVGLTTLALHHGRSPAVVAGYLHSERGARFLADCARLGLAVEYELHAMGELLPRELFAREPTLFRVDEQGERSPDANLCVHSARALELVA